MINSKIYLTFAFYIYLPRNQDFLYQNRVDIEKEVLRLNKFKTIV